MREENVPTAQACGLAGEVVRTFGNVHLRVFGTSMAPSILPGDLISVERTSLRDVSPGEVVVFSQKGRLVMHRVVRGADHPDEPRLITRGDRLCHDDPPVSSSELLGRVFCVERGTRRIEFTARPNGWERVLVRVLRISDYATYAYLRLAALWERFVGPEASAAKARNSLTIGVVAEAPAHKPNESLVAELPARDAEGGAPCRAQ